MSVLERDVVVVSGPDAFSFLQSLVSQDVEGLDDGAVVASWVVNVTGADAGPVPLTSLAVTVTADWSNAPALSATTKSCTRFCSASSSCA